MQRRARGVCLWTRAGVRLDCVLTLVPLCSSLLSRPVLLRCIPGSIQYKGCKIQLLDLPGIIEGAKDGKGRGRQVIGVARTCNLILIVLDAGKPMIHKRIIEQELDGFGIRLNQQPPNIILKRKEKGGVSITKACTLTKLDAKMIKDILKEYKVSHGTKEGDSERSRHRSRMASIARVDVDLPCLAGSRVSQISNCDITFRDDANVDQLIDVIEGNRKYTPCLYVMNSQPQTQAHAAEPEREPDAWDSQMHWQRQERAVGDARKRERQASSSPLVLSFCPTFFPPSVRVRHDHPGGAGVDLPGAELRAGVRRQGVGIRRPSREVLGEARHEAHLHQAVSHTTRQAAASSAGIETMRCAWWTVDCGFVWTTDCHDDHAAVH